VCSVVTLGLKGIAGFSQRRDSPYSKNSIRSDLPVVQVNNFELGCVLINPV